MAGADQGSGASLNRVVLSEARRYFNHVFLPKLKYGATAKLSLDRLLLVFLPFHSMLVSAAYTK